MLLLTNNIKTIVKFIKTSLIKLLHLCCQLWSNVLEPLQAPSLENARVLMP